MLEVSSKLVAPSQLTWSGLYRKTQALINEVEEILAAVYPQTVRQVFYALVIRKVLPNDKASYRKLVNALSEARKRELIPWDRIEDRLRRPHSIPMWSDPAEFADDAVTWYRRDIWPTQPQYIEVWLEKDALSGIFGDILRPYCVTLNVGRGYDSWSAVNEAAERFCKQEKPGKILYCGDHDASGEDIQRSLIERLGERGAGPKVERVAILQADIERYRLPPDRLKKTRVVAASSNASAKTPWNWTRCLPRCCASG